MNNDLAQWRSRIATGRELHRLNYLLAMTRMSDFAISRSGARDFSFFFCGEIVTKTMNPFFDIITRIARFVRFNETEGF